MPDSLRFDAVTSPLGTIYLIFSEEVLYGVTLVMPSLIRRPCPRGMARQVHAYFSGESRRFNLKTGFLVGTDFQRRVWRALLDIPYGQTRSYGWLARRLGSPCGQRAVGQALAANPLPIVLPCHRVVRVDGTFGGFSLGARVKAFLISLELSNLQSCRDGI
ncbi:MAG: methylated-DNA--[protein]-cysteine S-methyltransferase [Thermodesulfovibrionales bacterium]